MRIFSFAGTYRFKFFAIFVVALCFVICGCTSLLNKTFSKALPPMEGEQIVPGLSQKAIVKRDNLGIPLIEAANMDDLIFTMGYVSSYDRFTQMEGFRLIGKGRLSELLGKATLQIDIYMRALNIKQIAETLYSSASPEIRHILENYSNGVNAYLATAQLPTTLKLAGYKPEPWKPIDCVYVFVVLTLGLSQNLHEEIDILNIAKQVDVDKLAWLIPIYPDEPLPFDEMKKLKELDLKKISPDTARLSEISRKFSQTIVSAAAASNNWVVSGKLTKSGKPILANDTHLPLSMPSIWHMMHLKCPEVEGAGIAIAGVPGIIAGYNRNIAVGMTMVMADNQDLFLEKLKQEQDGLYYLYKDKWYKANSRQEEFKVKGQKDIVTTTMHETRHGVLLNNILTEQPRHFVSPMPVNQSIGIALSWAAKEPDRTMDAFFNIMRAKSVDDILNSTSRNTSIIPLNLVMADKNNIAWQVTGRFPLRKKGRGLCPSPGWTGEYDWNGYLDPSLHPSLKNPEKGYVGTANHRTVPADFPYILSSSWYYPDRAERIDQMMQGVKDYTAENAKAMQLDVSSPFVKTVKAALFEEKNLQEMSAFWKASNQSQKGEKAISVLRDFDGVMRVDSAGAAFYGAFLSSLSKNLFADELGGVDSQAYQSLLETFLMKYSALHDHLTDRGKNSPFWKGKRSQILAQTVLDAVALLEKRCGKNTEDWEWGKLHTYYWRTDATMLSDYMDFISKTGMKFLSGYFDRGPYPAPGDHTTLNVAAYHPGKDFDVWLVPEMRIIVDFGNDEPLIGINSTGQSDNPSSPHYDDGITAYREGRYQNFPFKEENIKTHYTKMLTLLPKK
jgi:acyl-homoserine-lactone acylase